MTRLQNPDSFASLRRLQVGEASFDWYSVAALREAGLGEVERLPFSLKVLLENLLRHEDGHGVTADHVRAVCGWLRERSSDQEVPFLPARIMIQDSAGIPLLADLAAMRDAIVSLGGDPAAINPVVETDLIVDHSLIVDVAGSADAAERNVALEFRRNRERYAFLRWAQGAFDRLRVLPPGVGICHQVNLEYLSRVVWTGERAGRRLAYPDTVLGTDSHTPMVNSLGVAGWGIGGIEAASAMLGQPVSLIVPEVIGCRLMGSLRPGVTATDLVLTLTEVLRKRGVVQKFVEFHGPALRTLALPDRATVANMAPEYGATMGFFPVDSETVAYLAKSGRDAQLLALVEAYARAQGLWYDGSGPDPLYTDVVELDLASVEPSVAGPRRPQDRMPLSAVAGEAEKLLAERPAETRDRGVPMRASDHRLRDGDVVLAAITSCTNTSNSRSMLAAGLLARNAVERGLKSSSWVKTSLAPGSRVVADYLAQAGLQPHLDALGFQVVGFGCTTCMGNSGPLAPEVGDAIDAGGVQAVAVLSGNRNFEGRVHGQCRLNYLGSPPLVVAYAIAGTVRRDLSREPLGEDRDGKPVYLADIWPDQAELEALEQRVLGPEQFRARYGADVVRDARWDAIPAGSGRTFAWPEDSSYMRRPPFFEDMALEPAPVHDLAGMRPLVILGDSVTTDHISPIGVIPADGPAGRYLIEQGVAPQDFNFFGARRVNHEVMIRGTFSNAHLRNEMLPDGRRGGWTVLMPEGEVTTIHEAATQYAARGVPLVVIAGRDYGSGSSRDWAAKGTWLLGVRAVIAESLERIHRSNLIGMGVLPLQFDEGTTRASLGLDGSEVLDVLGLEDGLQAGMRLTCRIRRPDGSTREVPLRCRLDTPLEVEYYRNGGILQTVLRRTLAAGAAVGAG